MPVFERGLKFYNEISGQIITELESEIKRTEREAEGIQKVKEAQIKQILSAFEITTATLEIYNRQKLEDAVRTLRDLPVFGYHRCGTNFKWPTSDDLL